MKARIKREFPFLQQRGGHRCHQQSCSQAKAKERPGQTPPARQRHHVPGSWGCRESQGWQPGAKPFQSLHFGKQPGRPLFNSILKSKLNQYTNQTALPTKRQPCGTRRHEPVGTWTKVQVLFLPVHSITSVNSDI